MLQHGGGVVRPRHRGDLVDGRPEAQQHEGECALALVAPGAGDRLVQPVDNVTLSPAAA